MAHHHIVEFHGLREAKRVADFFGLLVDLVLVNGVTVDHLVQHVHFPSTGEHKRILQSKRKFVFYLNVADGEAAIEFKFCGFDHVFGAVQHEAHLKICAVEHQVHAFYAYLLALAHHPTLAHVTVSYIDKVNLIRPLGQQPLFCVSGVVLGPFGAVASME